MRTDFRLYSIDNYWDIDEREGIPYTVAGPNEEMQRAQVAAFLQKGSIPLLEETGNDWLLYLMKELSFVELDAQIRQNIILLSESHNFVPSYVISDNQLTLTIKRVELIGSN